MVTITKESIDVQLCLNELLNLRIVAAGKHIHVLYFIRYIQDRNGVQRCIIQIIKGRTYPPSQGLTRASVHNIHDISTLNSLDLSPTCQTACLYLPNMCA